MTYLRSLKRHCAALALIVASVALVVAVPSRPAASDPDQPNIALRWNDALLQGVRESSLGPPMIARALPIAHTCMFDAWAAYDEGAIGTQLGDSLRRPLEERTAVNRSQRSVSPRIELPSISFLRAQRFSIL